MDATIGDVLVRRVDLIVPPSAPMDRSLRSAAGRGILRGLVAEFAGLAPSDVLVEARCPDCGGPHGRPVVMGPEAARSIRISLAYAGDTVIAAARRRHAVGVDAERRDGPLVADRRTAVREITGSSGGEMEHDDREDDVDALLHWTRIEAVLKADGRGLRVDPASVRFESRRGRLIASVPGDSRRYDVQTVALGDDLFVSTATAE